MKKLLPFMLLLSCMVAAVSAIDLVAVDSKADLQRESDRTPLLVFLSLDCDLGSYAGQLFAEAFYDLKGLKGGIYNINSFPYELLDGHNIELGSLVLLSKGKVLASSADSDTNQLELWGFNGQRAWVTQTLRANGIRYTMQDPGPQRLKALPESTSSVDLDRGLIGRFTFDDNKDVSGQGSIVYSGRDGGIASGLYNDDGVYTDSKYPLTIYNYQIKPEAYTVGFGFSFNVRLSSSAVPWSKSGVFFSGGYRTFTVGRNQDGVLYFMLEPGKIVNVNRAANVEPITESWNHAVVADEVDFPMDKWLHIQFSGDFASKRLKIMVDGKRLDDAVLPDQLLRLLKTAGASWGPYQMAELGTAGRGAILYGDMDDLLLYNRSLNAAELTAIASRDSKSVVNTPITNTVRKPLPNLKEQLEAAAGQWSGGWDTFWGSSGKNSNTMELLVSGQKVSGIYDHDGGQIDGLVSLESGKLVLAGTWKQTKSNGWFKFFLLSDGTGFSGTWGYTGKAAAADGWHARRQAMGFGFGLTGPR